MRYDMETTQLYNMGTITDHYLSSCTVRCMMFSILKEHKRTRRISHDLWPLDVLDPAPGKPT